MPRQKTGRPVGKPPKYLSKEEQPVTVSLRLPRDLAEQAKRYVTMHRVKKGMTELLLDGLRWRITEGDPRGLGIDLPPELGQNINEEYYGNTDIAAPVLEELRTALARQERQLQALVQALEHRSVVAPEPGTSETFPSNGNTVLQHTATDDTPGRAVELAPMPDAPESQQARKRGKQRMTPTQGDVSPPDPAILSDANMPAFDTSKYSLGKLCPRGHEHGTTGMSLRRLPRRVCPQCDTEQTQERRESKRETPLAARRAAPVPARRATRSAARA